MKRVFIIIEVYIFNRPTLSSLAQQMTDDKPLRFTDSPQYYLNSNMSTTSGLGSNYTTNTSTGLSSSLSGGTNQQMTPSPRRKSSCTSFTNDIPELSEDLSRDRRYVLNDYHNFRPNVHHAGYFGKKNLPGPLHEWYME